MPLSLLYLLSLWTTWKGIIMHYAPHILGLILVIVAIVAIIADR